VDKASETVGNDPAELGRAVADAARRLAVEHWNGPKPPGPVRVSVELEVSVGLRPDPTDLTEMSLPPEVCLEICIPQRDRPPICYVVCLDPGEATGSSGSGGSEPFEGLKRYCEDLRRAFEKEESAVKRLLLLLSMHRIGCVDLEDRHQVAIKATLPPED
jgi:hypothetical protein